MTALAGYWAFGGVDEPSGRCDRMLRAQQIYAPGPPATWSGGDIALGRRLFPTLAEDRFDRGPVTGGGGRWTLIADVRLDNRAELCTALGLDPDRAATLSDAAIVMAAVERWHDDMFDRLYGDFALALWDRDRARLLLARDFVGQKPLHYHRGSHFFAFASMAKGLHALPEIPPAPDCEAVAAFVALMPETGSETFFAGIRKVLPGHVVTVTRDGIRSERWWRPPVRELGLNGTGDYAEAMREHFDRAVEARLRGADGRVASHLSAGLDSSTVTATAARLLAPSGGRVTAFTSVPRPGFSDRLSAEIIPDEGPHAASVAALYPNIEHVLVPYGGSPLAGLDRHFFLHERPILNLCNAVWANQINDRARERGLAILLTGQRGNVSISYDGMPFLTQLASSGRFLRLARESIALVRNGTRVGTVAAQTIGPFLPALLWRAIGRMRGRGRKLTDYTAINPSAIETMRLNEIAAERGLDPNYRPRRDAHETRLWAIGRNDPGNYNKGNLAGWGIDTRDPTADRRLVEFCLSVPLEEYLRGGRRRALARTAFADRLPRVVAEEKRKGYQAAEWFSEMTAARGDIEAELGRIAASAPACVALDAGKMERLLAEWPSTGSNKQSIVEKYRLALLRGVSAGHFVRKASGSNQ
ncbi:MAG TPA: asparagine synthase-related protein [Allosphingosinicella sp.]|nr:asparagine synthase-related protein [Allosphingosinicella sp.]